MSCNVDLKLSLQVSLVILFIQEICLSQLHSMYFFYNKKVYISRKTIKPLKIVT